MEEEDTMMAINTERSPVAPPRRTDWVTAAAAVFFTLLSTTATAFAFTTTTTTTTTTSTTPFYRLGGSNGNDIIALYAEEDGGSALSKPAYNDAALFNFHMLTQAQKIRDYSAMDSYVDTSSLWNLAWHDSFVRNGLSDLVPPLTDSLNVLVIGNRYGGPTGEVMVVGEDDLDAADSAASAVDAASISPATNDDEGAASVSSTEGSAPLQKSQDSSCSFLAAIFDDDDTKRLGEDADGNDALDLASYDVIMDQGLIADLLTSSTDNIDDPKIKEDVARLLYEATKRIVEMGVYVANTPPMSSETKEYLKLLGKVLGLQWEFDLDGISDEDVVVSVARKYGTCPPVFGKLEKFTR